VCVWVWVWEGVRRYLWSYVIIIFWYSCNVLEGGYRLDAAHGNAARCCRPIKTYYVSAFTAPYCTYGRTS